ncbi:putative Vitamin B12 import system, periplasmic binding protein BtuF [Nitrospira defluvii]|uniref:Putative Vitamin B12 import system, periplasmic binding protein BtuF n=1 Tax=Nitrospira defluvii TaxID=330214 RepID=D8PGJ3_9BACT|nr:putative Vitamin B12 import system, periplasmic binding protein BtuF [Nitrospira defluvii]
MRAVRIIPGRRFAAACIGVVASMLVACLAFAFGETQEDHTVMKRRQQGILTGMPFMANITPRTFIDDAGRKLYVAKAPTRVVSLAPSITEMLFALGLDEQIVGVTDFCNFPVAAKAKAKVGYANPNLESLVALRPELIVAPREFHRANVLAKLEELKIPVLLLEATSVESIFSHIHTLGRIFDRSTEAHAMTAAMRSRMAELTARTEHLARVRVLYVINSQPLITVGPGSYIHQMIGLAGGLNIAAEAKAPYPRLTMETVLKEDPEILLFPRGSVETVSRSEQEAWRRWTTVTAVRESRLREVSADALNRPGPRVMEGLEALARAIHPEAFASESVPVQP